MFTSLRSKWGRWDNLTKYCTQTTSLNIFGNVDLTVKLMPHLRFSRMPGGGFSAGTGGGNTFDGEYQRKDDERDRLDHKDDRQD